MMLASTLARRALLSTIGASALVMALLTGQTEAEPACESDVTIERGDTLAKIARRCDMSLSTLLQANPQLGNPNVIEPGTMIKMPDSITLAVEERRAIEADQGDTLVSIADKLQMPLAYLVAANPEVDPHEIEPGMKVAMPAEQ